jgi:hypothetical protein
VPNWSISDEVSGAGASFGLGAGKMVGLGDLGFAVADLTGSGGSVPTAGTIGFMGDGDAVGVGVLGAGRSELWAGGAGSASSGAGPTGTGVAPGPLTVVDDPAGTVTSDPPALASTVPEIVTIVVSPFGDTATYESEPARITDAMPAVRTS